MSRTAALYLTRLPVYHACSPIASISGLAATLRARLGLFSHRRLLPTPSLCQRLRAASTGTMPTQPQCAHLPAWRLTFRQQLCCRRGAASPTTYASAAIVTGGASDGRIILATNHQTPAIRRSGASLKALMKRDREQYAHTRLQRRIGCSRSA